MTTDAISPPPRQALCVAALGAGPMGAAMVRNIAAVDRQVSVWNRPPDKASCLAAPHITPAADPAEAGLTRYRRVQAQGYGDADMAATYLACQ